MPYLRSRVVLFGLQDGLKASLANPDWISTLFHRISVVSTGLKSLGFPLRLGSLCNLRSIKARSDCSSWKIARSYHLAVSETIPVHYVVRGLHAGYGIL